MLYYMLLHIDSYAFITCTEIHFFFIYLFLFVFLHIIYITLHNTKDGIQLRKRTILTENNLQDLN